MNAILQAELITAGYTRRPVLADISLAVSTGQVCGVVGPNGSGKSTLLKVLAGQMAPTQGRVRFSGTDLACQSSAWIASRIARSPQVEVSTWGVTVEQAVTLGRAAIRGWFRPFTANDRTVVSRCIADTDLTDFATRTVTELSAGEAQRVLIARAMAQEPQVLLLDEPTSHLDLKHQSGMLDLCRRLARERGLCVVVVLHDLSLAANFCDQVAVLSAGRLVGEGVPREVFTPELLSRVYDIPVRIISDSQQLFIATAGASS